MARKKVTIEDLAGMVKRGFDGVDKRFDGVDDRMATKQELHSLEKEMRDSFAHVNARLDTIRHDISDFPAMRASLQDLHHRVERLEHKAAAR